MTSPIDLPISIVSELIKNSFGIINRLYSKSREIYFIKT